MFVPIIIGLGIVYYIFIHKPTSSNNQNNIIFPDYTQEQIKKVCDHALAWESDTSILDNLGQNLRAYGNTLLYPNATFYMQYAASILKRRDDLVIKQIQSSTSLGIITAIKH